MAHESSRASHDWVKQCQNQLATSTGQIPSTDPVAAIATNTTSSRSRVESTDSAARQPKGGALRTVYRRNRNDAYGPV
jgi:hypothetical protein